MNTGYSSPLVCLYPSHWPTTSKGSYHTVLTSQCSDISILSKKKGGGTWALSLRGTAHHGGEVWQWEREVAGHIVSAI